MKKCCNNCIHLDKRTLFCRRNPPTPVLGKNYDKNDVEVVFSTTLFPKIIKPELDWCSEFKSN